MTAQGVGSADGGMSCQPLPCPSGAPWNKQRCACVAADAGSQAECQKHTDCALESLLCCGPCLPPSRDQVRAVPKAKVGAARRETCPGSVACGACYGNDPDPVAPLFVAACVAERCELLDLRADAVSACETDSDCEPVSRGCCPAYSEDPSEYVGLQLGAERTLLECAPPFGCTPPTEHAQPIAYCAPDAHCAVRRRETVRGEPSSECYSPNQHVERARDAAAVGCDCDPSSAPECRDDGSGQQVKLVCNGLWRAAADTRCPK